MKCGFLPGRCLTHEYISNGQETVHLRRDRKSTLFCNAWELAAADGCMEDVKAVIEYALPVSGEDDSLLTDYRFSVVPRLSFGNNEGIYLELYLEGIFDSSGRKEAHIGTVKTLRTDMEACQLMGSLGGALMYFAAQHVSQNLLRKILLNRYSFSLWSWSRWRMK